MTVEPQTLETPLTDPLGLADEPEGAPPASRPRRRRQLAISREAVQAILAQVKGAEDERADWADRRVARYAKFRGWRGDRLWPWKDASNAHFPLLLEKVLHVEANFTNALSAQRPLVQAKATKKVDKERLAQVTALHHHQWVEEDDGEAKEAAFVQQATQDGTVLVKSFWVTDRRTVTEVRRVEKDPRQTLLAQMAALLDAGAFLDGLTEADPLDPEGRSWRGLIEAPGQRPERVTIEVYDHPDTVAYELEITRRRLLDEGPTSQVLPLEDVVVPMRCENPHPVSPRNPAGAPWIAHLAFVSLDELQRGRDAGWFSVTDDEWATIVASAEGPVSFDAADQTDTMQSAKEAQQGLSPTPGGQARDRWGVRVVEWYGGQDVNGDGLTEEVVVWIARTAQIALGAKYLTEVMPGVPLQRPFARTPFIAVPGQFYGMSLLELLEGLNDLIHSLVNQAIDNGTLANVPFGFYEPSSQMKAEPLRIEPGVLFPQQAPQQTVYFPQMQGRDQSFNLNMVGTLVQEADKISAAGPLQQGLVPTGKASALRTAGTTLAILQQGAVQPQAILKGLYRGLCEMFRHRHRLNVRFLKPGAAYKVIGGTDQPSEDAWATIQDPTDLDGPIDFGFEASLLNANKGVLAQSLTELASILVSPIGLQSGAVTIENLYHLFRDLVKAYELDASRYVTKPAGVSGGPTYTAEEIMAEFVLVASPVPSDVGPAEPTAEHLDKLAGFVQNSTQFGQLLPDMVAVLVDWSSRMQARLQQEAQQQALMQAAAQFGGQGPGGTGAEGPGGVPSQMGAPPMSMNAPDSREAQNQPGPMAG